MKEARVASIAIFIVVTLFSIGLVSALTTNDVTIIASLSNPSPRAGDSVLVSVTFQSKVAQELKIYAIGVHADWMQADQLFGPNLSSNPATVEANGVYTTQFAMQIPSSASLGSHTYTVGVDGLDSTGTAFSLNSAEATLQVQSPSSGTGGPSTSGNPDFNLNDWLPWIVLAIAAIIVAFLVIFFVMRSKKPRKTKIVPASSEAPAAPREEPGSDNKSGNENFDI